MCDPAWNLSLYCQRFHIKVQALWGPASYAEIALDDITLGAACFKSGIHNYSDSLHSSCKYSNSSINCHKLWEENLYYHDESVENTPLKLAVFKSLHNCELDCKVSILGLDFMPTEYLSPGIHRHVSSDCITNCTLNKYNRKWMPSACITYIRYGLCNLSVILLKTFMSWSARCSFKVRRYNDDVRINDVLLKQAQVKTCWMQVEHIHNSKGRKISSLWDLRLGFLTTVSSEQREISMMQDSADWLWKMPALTPFPRCCDPLKNPRKLR